MFDPCFQSTGRAYQTTIAMAITTLFFSTMALVAAMPLGFVSWLAIICGVLGVALGWAGLKTAKLSILASISSSALARNRIGF